MQEIIQFINQHPVLSIIWLGFLFAVLFTTFKSMTAKVKMITCKEAVTLINKEEAIIVDLRHRDDFRKGHIIGAVNLLLDEIKVNKVSKLEKCKFKPIVIIDNTNMQAQESADIIIKLGFKNVYVLKDGIISWRYENLPLINSK